MRRSRDKRFSKAYRELHDTLSTVLWEEDPDGLGITIGSPNDEYDDYSTKLIVELSKNSEDVSAVLSEWFGERLTEPLVERVTSAWAAYEKARAETPTQAS
jgi:hypothetical protein